MRFYERNPHIKRPIQNATSPSQLLDGTSREQILRSAFFEMRDHREWRGKYLWSWVGSVTGHGSGYSTQICHEMGWDPDMTISSKAELPRTAAPSTRGSADQLTGRTDRRLTVDAMKARAQERHEAETDSVQREAYALAKRAGFDWYETESAARRMAEHAAEEICALRTTLEAVRLQTKDWTSHELRDMGMETTVQMVNEALLKLASCES